MALHFLGRDPSSPDGQSPTVYYDEERTSQLDIPAHETVIELPRRMMQFFPEVNGGS